MNQELDIGENLAGKFVVECDYVERDPTGDLDTVEIRVLRDVGTPVEGGDEERKIEIYANDYNYSREVRVEAHDVYLVPDDGGAFIGEDGRYAERSDELASETLDLMYNDVDDVREAVLEMVGRYADE